MNKCVWVDSLVVFIQAVGSVIVGSDFCVPATPPPFARALTLHVPYHMCLSLALYCISNPCTLVCTRFNKGFELELELELLTLGRSFFKNSSASRYLVMNMLGMCIVCDKIPPAHWDPITPTCTLGPPHSYLHTGTPTLGPPHSYLHTVTPHSYLHTVTPTLLPAHWDPHTPTCTLGPPHSYMHIGTPLLIPAHCSKTHSPNVPTRAGTCRHMCRHLQVPTRADIRHTNHTDFFYLQTGMCWHVSALEKVPTPGKVPTRAGTSSCRHVPTSVILIIWTFLSANWDVLACVSTWKSADTWEGADTCRHV